MRRPLIALVVLLVALAVGYAVRASDNNHSAPPNSSAPVSGSPTGTGTGQAVALSSLPPQAAATVSLIRAGGPFPYPRNDGVVFHNNEHHLPARPDGYYHEYTVPTPGADDSGGAADHHRPRRRVLLHRRSLRALRTGGHQP